MTRLITGGLVYNVWVCEVGHHIRFTLSQQVFAMPVISNLDFNSLSSSLASKFNEYSRLEQIGGVVAGLITLYALHAVCSFVAGRLTSGFVCFCVESD